MRYTIYFLSKTIFIIYTPIVFILCVGNYKIFPLILNPIEDKLIIDYIDGDGVSGSEDLYIHGYCENCEKKIVLLDGGIKSNELQKNDTLLFWRNYDCTFNIIKKNKDDKIYKSYDFYTYVLSVIVWIILFAIFKKTKPS